MERGLLAGPEPRGQGGRCPPAWAQRCRHLCTHPCTAITTRGRRWQSRALAANHSLGTVAAQAPGRAPWGAGNREPLRAQGRSWMGWRGIRPLPSRGNPGLRSQAAREQISPGTWRDSRGRGGRADRSPLWVQAVWRHKVAGHLEGAGVHVRGSGSQRDREQQVPAPVWSSHRSIRSLVVTVAAQAQSHGNRHNREWTGAGGGAVKARGGRPEGSADTGGAGARQETSQ